MNIDKKKYDKIKVKILLNSVVNISNKELILTAKTKSRGKVRVVIKKKVTTIT